MQYYGYAGKVLYVDLSSGQTRIEPLDMNMAEQFIGGWGIGERLLCDILKPDTDPLSPDNPIIIGAGPLVGTLVPSSNKIQLITKSATPANKQSSYYIGPASGGSNRFGIMMKNAGYDQLVITGKASKPVYLSIQDDAIKICDAGDLWGKEDPFSTTDTLKKRHKGCGVIAIGRGGENQVVFSLAFVDKRNTIGRNGGASVMGSKNLKAIAVYGTKGVKVWNSEGLLRLADGINQKSGAAPLEMMLKPKGIIPAASTSKVDWNKLYPVELFEKTFVELKACAGCPTPCRAVYKVNEGEYAGTELSLGYFGHVGRYGRYMELEDYTHAMKLIDTLNKTGLCYVTTLAMIRFITALYQRGSIGKSDTDGLELKMGDINSYLKLIEKTADREGIGDTMAKGWYALSERLGVDEAEYEDGRGVVKGTSVILGAQERTLPLLLSPIVNPRGGMHLHPQYYFPNLPADKLKEWCQGLAMSPEDIDRIIIAEGFDCGRFQRHVEDGEATYWATGVCALGAMLGYQSVRSLAGLYTQATGIEIAPEELKKAGERIWNLCKLLNVREGFSRADDKWPGLWVKSIDEPVKKFVLGELQLKDYCGRPVTHSTLESVIDSYYNERGWDVKTGVPASKKLAELGLEELAGMLKEEVHY